MVGRNAFVGILLLLMAILFIVMGIQGSLGKVVAVMFVPGELVVNSQAASTLSYTQPQTFMLPNTPTTATGVSLF